MDADGAVVIVASGSIVVAPSGVGVEFPLYCYGNVMKLAT